MFCSNILFVKQERVDRHFFEFEMKINCKNILDRNGFPVEFKLQAAFLKHSYHLLVSQEFQALFQAVNETWD